jgi:hypothetical protein
MMQDHVAFTSQGVAYPESSPDWWHRTVTSSAVATQKAMFFSQQAADKSDHIPLKMPHSTSDDTAQAAQIYSAPSEIYVKIIADGCLRFDDDMREFGETNYFGHTGDVEKIKFIINTLAEAGFKEAEVSHLATEICGLFDDLGALHREGKAVAECTEMVGHLRKMMRIGAEEVTQKVKLPETAPELYANRPVNIKTGRRETIVEFLERVWLDPWIKAGVLTRLDFRRLDPPGETRLRNWLIDNQLPPHLHLPTISEVLGASPTDAAGVRAARRTLRRFERHRHPS